jgi:tRNA (mo5U34)-methyltransferase
MESHNNESDGISWYHSIDLGDEVTPGAKPAEVLEQEWNELALPPLRGKTVLDIGAWDGYFSFRAEREGAARVVAVDHYVWSLRLPEQREYWQRAKRSGEESVAPHLVPGLWDPQGLPGRAGFDRAKARLNSQVEPMILDFSNDNLDALGKFDVVIFAGVLYHLENPMDALRRLAAVTREMAAIRTVAVHLPNVNSAVWEFYPGSELEGDATNWWAPNKLALEGAVKAAGFGHVVSHTQEPRGGDSLSRYLLTAQAWV